MHLEFGEPDFEAPAVVREAAEKALEDGQTKYVSSPATWPSPPEPAFGPGAEGYLRFSYASSIDRISEGLRRIGRFLALRR